MKLRIGKRYRTVEHQVWRRAGPFPLGLMFWYGATNRDALYWGRALADLFKRRL